jgi:AcrR family transcriptional regulator
MTLDQEKLNHLFTGACPLFDRFGYRKTTVEEICSAAGISKRTFYEEFQDKADFFGRLMLDRALFFLREWQKESEPIDSAVERIELLIDRYIAITEKAPIFRLMFESQETLDAVSDAFSEEGFGPLTAAMVPTLEMGMKSGELRPMNAENTAAIIGTMLDSFFFILPQLFRNCPLSMDENFVPELKTFIIHGLLAR